MRLILALLLVSSLPTYNTNVGADSLIRSLCQCQGKYVYSTVQQYEYHSDRTKRTYNWDHRCGLPLDMFGNPDMGCNMINRELKSKCKDFDDNIRLCYERNLAARDSVLMNCKKSRLPRKSSKHVKLFDCTETCRKYWPVGKDMSGHCNATNIHGELIVPQYPQCTIDIYENLRVL